MKTSTKPVGLDTIIRQQLADALVSAAKEQGLSLLEGQLTCDLANGFTILAAPIARTETPTEKELTDGVGLIYAYLSHAESKELPAGFYTIRMATGGYNFKDGSVKISFIDAKGKTAYSFKGATAELRKGAGQSTPSPEDFAVRSVTHGMVCGSRKCFKWDRVGWGKWEYGCVDMDSNPVSCR
jgi:hypothetical protein